MKFNLLISLVVLLFTLFSCDSGLKFENPNDPDNTISQSGMGELGGECYPNKTCNEGLICDEESNSCMKEPENTEDNKTDTASENDDEDMTVTDSENNDDKTDTVSTNDEDMTVTDSENNDNDSDSTDTTPDNDSDNTEEPNDGDSDSQEPSNPDEDDTETDDHDSGGSGVYDTEINSDEDIEICIDSCVPIEPECLPEMAKESDAGLCNGLDDDCDGKVDEGCLCSPGQTQPCFLGPRNFRNIGTCQDGVQTCKITLGSVYGTWGECTGGISPSSETCDNADNNCNGCTDDKLCCAPPIDCAYNIGVAQPFADKIIDGTQIYDTGHTFNDTDTATWEWTLTKGPCDEVLGKVNSYMKGAKTQEELGTLAESDRKTVLNGLGLSQLKLRFRLSGSYKLHLKVTRENGEVYECEWILKVVSAGLRIELCWDTNTEVDADLHLGKNGVTTGWTNNTACLFSTQNPNWGYPKTDNYDKDGNWKTSMNNPRLDIDNIAKGPIPENINLDNPEPDDVFRVGVRYYLAPNTSNNKPTHPVVNVYCGGTLKATYGVEPQVSNFNSKDDFWKVVEIKWVGDYLSDACELTPRWDDSTGYVVHSSIPTYTSWYLTDPCSPNPCSGIENSTGTCTATSDETYSCECKSGYLWTNSQCKKQETEEQCASNSDCSGSTPYCSISTSQCIANAIFITEYVEGSAYNKAIEIYNGSKSAVNLSNFTIQLAENGNDWGSDPTYFVFNFPAASIPSGKTLVFCNAAADTELAGKCDQTPTSGVFQFNGDDGIALFDGTSIVDQIGNAMEQIDWSVAGVSSATRDHTLRRKTSVIQGTTDWAASAGTTAENSQWIVLDKDTFDGLGTR